jgi:Domain of unknown function (DUF4350)
LSELSRHRPYLIAGGALVALGLILVLALVPSGAWVARDRRRSMSRPTPDGIAAWAQALDRLGAPAAPRYESFTDDPPRGRALVLMEPVVAPSVAEVHAVLEWVRKGGTFVYSPAASHSLFLDSLGIDVSNRPGGRPLSSTTRDSVAPGAWGDPGLTGPAMSYWVFEADSAPAARWRPLVVTAETRQPTVAWLPEGAGGVLIIADGIEVSNGSLRQSVAAPVITRAVLDRTPPGDTVFFSEFHLGLDGRRGIVSETLAIATESRWGRLALEMALVAFALLLLAERRFGSPLPEPESGRRSTLEHVAALANIYKAAHAYRLVARNLVRGAARRMGLPPIPTHTEPETMAAWEGRPDLAGPAAAALAAFRAEPPELATLEDALDTMVDRHATSFHGP